MILICKINFIILNFIIYRIGGRSSRHGLYKLGYTRVTKIITKRSKNLNWSRSLKNSHSSDCRLQLAYMKLESLVIVDQHATVNILGLCTHRPSRQGSNIDSKNLLFILYYSLIMRFSIPFFIIISL